MSMFSKTINNVWFQIKDTFGTGKFMRYSAVDTYVLVINTMVLIAEREYGAKTARLLMEWFDIDDVDSINYYKQILNKDKFLVDGDRSAILRSLLNIPISSIDIDNFENYLSSSQWFAAMIFIDPNYLRRDMGNVDDSALFPTNITRERTESYLSNPTKLSTFQNSVQFVKTIPFIHNNAMKLHLVAVTTSMIWYSNDDVWDREHGNMWVQGNQAKLWIERKARLNIERGQAFNKGGIF